MGQGKTFSIYTELEALEAFLPRFFSPLFNSIRFRIFILDSRLDELIFTVPVFIDQNR